MAVSLPLYPPAWHAALRTWLGWQAQRHGGELSIARVEGGILDTTQLYGVRWRQRAALPPAAGAANAGGTDLTVARADLTLAWTVPWFQQAAPSWVREIVLDGVNGQWDLGALGRPRPVPAALPKVENHGLAPAAIQGDGFARLVASVFPSLGAPSARLVPESFRLRADDLRLLRGRYRLRATGLRLSGSRDDAGTFLAREVAIAGPGFENTLVKPHAETYWKGSRLTISELDLATGLTLVRATLDGAHLDRHRLDWEGQMAALGGEVRGQGSINFSRERLALEVAATFQNAAVPPLARLLGIEGPADGVIDQGNLSFRGDPENWPAAEMWLAAHSRDLRWGKRAWEDLELRAVIVNRRVQVHRLELRQSGNRVSLTGECPLPVGPAGAETPRPWREGGFSCQVDARLDDLRSLSDLFAPHVPALDGRMSVNGRLTARPGASQDIDGYLNVEGTRLTLNGAPLDYLRSTLTFKDGALRVADLQATHDTDYFTGTGSMRLDGPPRYEGEGRAEVRRLSVYTPALAASPALLETLAKVNGLSTQLRWDDSVVRVEQCQGRLDGAPFVVGGTVDLHDGAQPILDLSLDAEGVVVRRVERQEVRADCVLTMRGQIGHQPILGGDVRLLGGGDLGLKLELAPLPPDTTAESPDGDEDDESDGPFLSLNDWFPEGWQAWCLDLDVTSASEEATVAPDLHVSSSGEDDLLDISGQIALHKAPAIVDGSRGEIGGNLYFYGDPGEAPEVSLTAKLPPRPFPSRKVDDLGRVKRFTGSATQLHEVPSSDVPPAGLRLSEGGETSTVRDVVDFPLSVADDTTPWRDWLVPPPGMPEAQGYTLHLR